LGSTNDPQRRLQQHNSNGVLATRGKGPWRIIKLIEFSDVSMARRAEAYLKRLKRRDLLDAVIAGRFAWPEDLQPL